MSCSAVGPSILDPPASGEPKNCQRCQMSLTSHSFLSCGHRLCSSCSQSNSPDGPSCPICLQVQENDLGGASSTTNFRVSRQVLSQRQTWPRNLDLCGQNGDGGSKLFPVSNFLQGLNSPILTPLFDSGHRESTSPLQSLLNGNCWANPGGLQVVLQAQKRAHPEEFNGVASNGGENGTRFCTCSDFQNFSVARCVDCNEDLCQRCYNAHQRVRLTRDHTVVSVSKNQPIENISPADGRDDAVLAQQGHVETSNNPKFLQVFADLVESSKAESENLIKSVGQFCTSLEESLAEIATAENSLNTRVASIDAEISMAMNAFQAQILTRQKELRVNLEKIQTVKLERLGLQKQSLVDQLKRFQEVRQELQAAVQSGSKLDLVSASNRATKALSDREQISLKVGEDAVITFERPIRDLMSMIWKFGILVGSAFAPNSYAEGLGIQVAIIGKESSFLIVTQDELGTHLSVGGVKISATVKDPDRNFIHLSIQDHQNGKYSVTWKAFKPGLHEISISIKDLHIRGSPFTIMARKSRNYFDIQEPLFTFGTEGNEDGQLCRPWGICCSKNGLVLVANRSNNRIEVFTEKGEFKYNFGCEGNLPGHFNRPSSLCCDSQNRVIVADKDNHRIQILTVDGTFVLMFGEKGSGHGQFDYPWDVACNGRDQIMVSDTRNHRIQLFDRNGRFLTKFCPDPRLWKHFDSPRGVCFKQDGRVFVTDFNNHRLVDVNLYTQKADYLGKEGSADGCFIRPNGVDIDIEGNIVIADSRNDRVQIFNSMGQFVAKFGTKGTEKGQFDRPSGLAVSLAGLIYVVDFGNNRVQVF